MKGRSVEDSACLQWCDISLQEHFLGTLEAGEKLCERMRDVLRDPASHRAVLTCFHRVMLLGFLGEYHTLDDPERRALIKILSERVMSFSSPQPQPTQASPRAGENINRWLVHGRRVSV